VILARISWSLVVFALTAAVAACSRGTPLTVINQSDVLLENVVLSGSGSSENIGSVPPHAQLRALVRPRGQSSLEIGFHARNRSVSFGPEGYFEGGGGYTVVVKVAPSLVVTVESLRLY
jgi:hypothetical protein